VDDVLEFGSLDTFPQAGERGKIYIAMDKVKQYRWTGTSYTVLSDSGLNINEVTALHVSNNPSVNNPIATIADLAAIGGGGGSSTPAVLYGSTGQATDGAMTQKAATDTFAGKADLLNGKLNPAQLPYVGFTPSNIKVDLKGTYSKWSEGELIPGSPLTPGSTPGMKFISGNGSTTYVYEYMLSNADRDGTLFNWVRMLIPN
jgi:hypothetical protein